MNKRLLLLLVLLLAVISVEAQQTYTSDDNTSANWTDYIWTKSAGWMNDRPRFNGNDTYTPDYGYWHEAHIYGYITRNGDFTVDGGGALNIYDTLRITQDLYSEQVINVHAGGILIVEGNYNADNGGVNTVGGTVVVLGDMLATGGADVDITGGDFYLVGDLTTTGEGEAFNGSSTPPAGYFKDEDDLMADADLYSFATGAPLPVEFVAVNVKKSGDHAIISWATASEVNNDFFSIERSSDGRYFESIGTLKGSGTTYELNTYGFTDTDPLVGESYYRVRQTDFDGENDVSWLVSLSNNDGFKNLEVFPNPASEMVNISLPAEKNVSVKIIDGIGAVHKMLAFEDVSIAKVSVEDLKRGHYLIIVESNNSRWQKRLLVK